MAAYLALCLAVSGSIAWSPWLHLALEHGSLDPAAAHTHRLGKSSLPKDYFDAFASTAGPVESNHAHPHPHAHPASEPEQPAQDGHSHHSLPEALAGGGVIVPDADASLIIGQPELCGNGDVFPQILWRYAAPWDLPQAARPPPRAG